MSTIYEFILALEILSKYQDNGLATRSFIGAEHDIIYSHITSEQIPECSKNGMTLVDLGWHIDSNTTLWAYFT